MQQLQSLYRGDSSPSLAQIFSMQYQPQQATSQVANTALSSGMSAGAQVKTTAMNNATQIGIADANRQQANRHFTLSHALQNRQQSEVERNNMATNEYNSGMLANNTTTTKWNAGGMQDAATDQADQAAQGELNALVTQIDTMISTINPNDPDAAAKRAQLEARKKQYMDGFKGAGRGQKASYVKGIMGILNVPKNNSGVIGTLATDLAGIPKGNKEYAPKPAAPALQPGDPGWSPQGSRTLGPGQADPYRKGSVELTEHGRSLYPNSNGWFPMTGETMTAPIGGDNDIITTPPAPGAPLSLPSGMPNQLAPTSPGGMTLQQLLNFGKAAQPAATQPPAVNPAVAQPAVTNPAAVTNAAAKPEDNDDRGEFRLR